VYGALEADLLPHGTGTQDEHPLDVLNLHRTSSLKLNVWGIGIFSSVPRAPGLLDSVTYPLL
jgi:hypothetical protein